MRDAWDRVGAAIDEWYERRQRRRAVIDELASGPSEAFFDVVPQYCGGLLSHLTN